MPRAIRQRSLAVVFFEHCEADVEGNDERGRVTDQEGHPACSRPDIQDKLVVQRGHGLDRGEDLTIDVLR
jgi:hypothetical protein